MISIVELSVALWCMLHRESFSLLPLSPFLTSIPPSLHPSCPPSPTLGIMQHSAGLTGERIEGSTVRICECDRVTSERDGEREYI